MFNVIKKCDDSSKTFVYHGITLTVANWIKFVAVDCSGTLWGFRQNPSYSTDIGWQSADNWFTEICRIEFEGNWKESLERIE